MGGLDQHIKRVLGIKDFECKECGKKFVTKGNLTQHYRTHSGEKPFKCKHPKCGCGRAFSQKQQVDRHIKRALKIREYKCTQCDMAFTTKYELTAHLRCHSG